MTEYTFTLGDWRRCYAGEVSDPALLPRREGCTFLAEVPPEWGKVISLERRNGRVVAYTESGNAMIVGTFGVDKAKP